MAVFKVSGQSLKKNRKLVSNFGYLSALKVFEYVFPLLTIPYLARVLGVAGFGLVSFAQAFASYFLILVDFGFNLSASKDISVHHDDRHQVETIYSSVMLVKTGLMIVTFIMYAVLVFGFARFRGDSLLYLSTFGLVVSSVLFPIWLFQGLQEMKFITLVQFCSRFIFTVLIFVLVRSSADILLVPLLNAFGGIIGGILSLLIVRYRLGIRLRRPYLPEIRSQIRSSFDLFLSNVSISLYTISNTFLLGLFWNDTIVGYYAGAEKILRPLQNMLQPITQAVYPHIAQIADRSRSEATAFLRKLVLLVGAATGVVSIAAFVLSPLLVPLILGPDFAPSILILRIMSPLPFVIALSNIAGIQAMLSFGYGRQFSRIIILCTVLHLTLASCLMSFGAAGVSTSVLVTEITITSVFFIFLARRGIALLPGTHS
ncbi:hypothetical protein AUK40_02095 [Candidatus Wirthbacteria bacterium CG2_30_54_11]|uniref:Polysaccharide biosynthesis protein C-terminal domain-containing protein n=1 Tax=Candidatus Wirthbacteria bacterium CG2_30_54_11 TaxID=1817892 RepID=A0A1J5IUF0_9BACT|nr:MAG: hypothetical protein AUK40_02095 [Candidatus Wirthbacteria bacterium CG2_30_54_11]